nr:MAG TPA: hypothetical protein [Caudoviricetes sp.]
MKFGDYGVIIYNSYRSRVRKLTKSYSSFLLIKIDQKSIGSTLITTTKPIKQKGHLQQE